MPDFEPVDHDPFADPGPAPPTIAQAMEHQQRWGMPPVLNQFGSIAMNAGSMLAAPLMAGPRLMGDVASGAIDPNSPEAIQRSTDVGLNFTGGGMLGAERGAAGIFGGKLAKNADLGALEQAQAMSKAGSRPSDIWDQTGWFRGADREWRFEIPDTASKLMREPAFGINSPDTMKDILDHPELYENYPELANIWAQRIRSDASNLGEYYPPNSLFPRDVIALRKGIDDPRSTALHELQHAVQHREGFDPGTNVSSAGGYGLYKRTIGEVEARNVEMRRNMTLEELKDSPPNFTQDVSNSNQIFARGGMSAGSQSVGEKSVSGRIAGIPFEATPEQHAILKEARSSGAGAPEIQKMLNEFKAQEDAAAKVNKTARYRLVMKARAGNTTGQWEEQQQSLQEHLRGIGYKGGFGPLPSRLVPVDHDPFKK